MFLSFSFRKSRRKQRSSILMCTNRCQKLSVYVLYTFISPKAARILSCSTATSQFFTYRSGVWTALTAINEGLLYAYFLFVPILIRKLISFPSFCEFTNSNSNLIWKSRNFSSCPSLCRRSSSFLN